MVHVLLKSGLENFEHYLLACEMSEIVWSFEHSLALSIRIIITSTGKICKESLAIVSNKINFKRSYLS